MPAEHPGDAALQADRVHFIGIGGAGMQALAEVLLARGVRVSGSDTRPSDALERLRAAGATVSVGQAAEQLGTPDAVVISAAVPEANEELTEARTRGITVASHAQVLGALSRSLPTVAIAGTHGKSTTTALTAHVLIEAGLDPVVLGGAYAPDLGGSGRAGRGNVMVVEADEFGRRFLELTPSVAVITNIEPDHLDYYGSFEAIIETFEAFAARLRPDGVLLFCSEGGISERIAADPRSVPYGAGESARWRILDYAATHQGSEFTVQSPAGVTQHVNSTLRGIHNALNATAAIATATGIGVAVAHAADAVASFQGTRRRFQTLHRDDQLWLVDDYAHHPTELRATLRAAREAHPGRIMAVFQPHTSHRTQALLDDFTSAFRDADEVILLPIYHPAGREPETLDISSETLAAAMRHPAVETVPHQSAAIERIVSALQPGTLVMLMGAGDVTDLGPRLLRTLRLAP